MTHLYFHYATPEGLLVDRFGASVADLVEAHEHATAIIRACIRRPGPEDWRAWTVCVVDEGGEQLFFVPFAAMLGRPN
jgi:hypothetical protein